MFHLHCASVIHGDLKPANVLLMNSRKDRRGFVAKVSDFGLAQVRVVVKNVCMFPVCATVHVFLCVGGVARVDSSAGGEVVGVRGVLGPWGDAGLQVCGLLSAVLPWLGPR